MVTVAGVRREVAARLTALGWYEAGVPYDLFGIGSVPDAVPATKAHLSFAVGVPASVDFKGRQKPAEGISVTTEVRVRFLAKHVAGPSTSQKSQDDALDAEHELEKAMRQPKVIDLELILTGAARSCPSPGNWFVHDVTLAAFHRLALQ